MKTNVFGQNLAQLQAKIKRREQTDAENKALSRDLLELSEKLKPLPNGQQSQVPKGAKRAQKVEQSFSTPTGNVIRNTTDNRDYLATNHTIYLNTDGHQHGQNKLHQNRHGVQSLIMGVPDHVYTQAVGEQIKNSNPPQAPKPRTIAVKSLSQHQITQPQNLLNNHTTTDAPRVTFKEHGGQPTDQGVNTLPNHPVLVSFDNQHKMFNSTY